MHDAFVEHVRVPQAALLPPVKVLCIDETRHGRTEFAQDPDTQRWVLACDRWHTGFVDAAGTGGLLTQVEGPTIAATICVADLGQQRQHRSQPNTQPASWRTRISHVSIDLSASYAKAVRDALPDAVLVADRFHLVAVGNDMHWVHQRVIRGTERRRTEDLPGGCVLPSADRTRAAPARALCEDVELAGRHRRRRGSDPRSEGYHCLAKH